MRKEKGIGMKEISCSRMKLICPPNTFCQLLNHGENIWSDLGPSDSVNFRALQSSVYGILDHNRVPGTGVGHPHDNP